VHRVDENVAAASVELTAEDLREIEESASKLEIQGGRYSEAAERMTGVEAPLSRAI
jgi:hypothetical protein